VQSTAPEAVQRPPGATAGPIADFVVAQPTHAPRAQAAQPNTARSISKVRPQPRASSTGHSARGSATWYCEPGVSVCPSSYQGGYYAAAGPALRVGAWRGRVVHVCGSGSCVNVRLVDWCACGGSHIIDLFGDAFQRLAPLSAGAVRVTVTW
jgi:rare lipoprotein A (peptidoglycan hydrolase)